jgi:hypothetical protein
MSTPEAPSSGPSEWGKPIPEAGLRPTWQPPEAPSVVEPSPITVADEIELGNMRAAEVSLRAHLGDTDRAHERRALLEEAAEAVGDIIEPIPEDERKQISQRPDYPAPRWRAAKAGQVDMQGRDPLSVTEFVGHLNREYFNAVRGERLDNIYDQVLEIENQLTADRQRLVELRDMKQPEKPEELAQRQEIQRRQAEAVEARRRKLAWLARAFSQGDYTGEMARSLVQHIDNARKKLQAERDPKKGVPIEYEDVMPLAALPPGSEPGSSIESTPLQIQDSLFDDLARANSEGDVLMRITRLEALRDRALAAGLIGPAAQQEGKPAPPPNSYEALSRFSPLMRIDATYEAPSPGSVPFSRARGLRPGSAPPATEPAPHPVPVAELRGKGLKLKIGEDAAGKPILVDAEVQPGKANSDRAQAFAEQLSAALRMAYEIRGRLIDVTVVPPGPPPGPITRPLAITKGEPRLQKGPEPPDVTIHPDNEYTDPEIVEGVLEETPTEPGVPPRLMSEDEARVYQEQTRAYQEQAGAYQEVDLGEEHAQEWWRQREGAEVHEADVLGTTPEEIVANRIAHVNSELIRNPNQRLTLEEVRTLAQLADNKAEVDALLDELGRRGMFEISVDEDGEIERTPRQPNEAEEREVLGILGDRDAELEQRELLRLLYRASSGGSFRSVQAGLRALLNEGVDMNLVEPDPDSRLGFRLKGNIFDEDRPFAERFLDDANHLLEQAAKREMEARGPEMLAQLDQAGQAGGINVRDSVNTVLTEAAGMGLLESNPSEPAEFRARDNLFDAERDLANRLLERANTLLNRGPELLNQLTQAGRMGERQAGVSAVNGVLSEAAQMGLLEENSRRRSGYQVRSGLSGTDRQLADQLLAQADSSIKQLSGRQTRRQSGGGKSGSRQSRSGNKKGPRNGGSNTGGGGTT